MQKPAPPSTWKRDCSRSLPEQPGESAEGEVGIELNTFLTPFSVCSLYKGPTHRHTHCPRLFGFFGEAQINTRQCCFMSARVTKSDNKGDRIRKLTSIRQKHHFSAFRTFPALNAFLSFFVCFNNYKPRNSGLTHPVFVPS